MAILGFHLQMTLCGMCKKDKLAKSTLFPHFNQSFLDDLYSMLNLFSFTARNESKKVLNANIKSKSRL